MIFDTYISYWNSGVTIFFYNESNLYVDDIRDVYTKVDLVFDACMFMVFDFGLEEI